MLCRVCNNLINKDVTIKNIFKPNIDKICNNCFMSNTFIQKLNIIPITDYVIEEHTLFEKEVNPLALMSFLKPYYMYYLKNKQENIILYFDTVDQLIYNNLQNIKLGNIFLLVLCNKKQKENDCYV